MKSSKYELTINGDLFGLNITLKPQDNWETIDSEMKFYKYSAWDITALNNTTLNNNRNNYLIKKNKIDNSKYMSFANNAT